MPRKLFITVSCLLLLTANGLAQDAPPFGGYMYVAPPTPDELQQEQQTDALNALDEQFEASMERATLKGMARSIWNGPGANLITFMGVAENPDIATAWGISNEQLAQLGERM